MTPGLTKGKKTPPLPPGFRPPQLALPCFRFSPGFPEGFAILKPSRIPAFEMLSINTSEAETYARILSAFSDSSEWVPDGYLNNKEDIGRVWRAASFPIGITTY